MGRSKSPWVTSVIQKICKRKLWNKNGLSVYRLCTVKADRCTLLRCTKNVHLIGDQDPWIRRSEIVPPTPLKITGSTKCTSEASQYDQETFKKLRVKGIWPTNSFRSAFRKRRQWKNSWSDEAASFMTCSLTMPHTALRSLASGFQDFYMPCCWDHWIHEYGQYTDHKHCYPKELGILQALGMTNRQLARMLQMEGPILAGLCWYRLPLKCRRIHAVPEM